MQFNILFILYQFYYCVSVVIYIFSCLQLVGNRVVGGVTGNNNNNNNVNPPLASCTRILAMNMIGDLMRKVGVSIMFLHSVGLRAHNDIWK